MQGNRLILVRTKEPSGRTIGAFMVVNDNGGIEYTCASLELPWRNNKRDVSCIPPDTYKLTKTLESPSFKYPHFDIHNVMGRSYIKIHVLNYVEQTRGCPGCGETVSEDGNNIWNSKKALSKLLWHYQKKRQSQL